MCFNNFNRFGAYILTRDLLEQEAARLGIALEGYRAGITAEHEMALEVVAERRLKFSEAPVMDAHDLETSGQALRRTAAQAQRARTEQHDPQAARIALRDCEHQLLGVREGGDWTTRVQLRLLACEGRYPTLGQLAEEYHLSERTLIRRLREESLGAQAADALAQLDQQQAQWQARLSDYAAERNRLRSAGLAERDLQQAIDALQARSFDERERLRVQALDGEL